MRTMPVIVILIPVSWATLIRALWPDQRECTVCMPLQLLPCMVWAYHVPPGSDYSMDTHMQEDNQLFKKEISFSQFYYMDRFILLCSGNVLYLYKYHIDTQPPDDIKRYIGRLCGQRRLYSRGLNRHSGQPLYLLKRSTSMIGPKVSYSIEAVVCPH